MNKFSLIFFLLISSFVSFSQKGISYQAVILDPNKIEIPGQDITGQPYVNSEVWVKFNISLGTSVQFEEVQQTETDAYGLVNLTIGSVANSSFNSLIWDTNQKSLQVYVSFNKGNTYTKVSDQKLLYVPYALNAESASKFAGIVPISSGGTGATNAIEALNNLGAAAIVSPTFVGTPQAPTPAVGNNSTQVATTAFVNSAIQNSNQSSNSSYVPYLGATKPVDLGAYDLIVNGVNIGLGKGNWNNYFPSDPSFSQYFPIFQLEKTSNTIVGKDALSNNLTGTHNIALGAQTMKNNTTGYNNSAIGFNALYSNTEGHANTAIGAFALSSNTNGGYNIANGAFSMQNNRTGSYNISSGIASLYNNNSGEYNIANGYQALYDNNTGNHNIASGYASLARNNSGSHNIGIGYFALLKNTEASRNISVGDSSLLNNLVGENVAIGHNSLLSNTTGSKLTAIGNDSDVSSNNLNNSTAIGYGAIVTESNTVQLGNSLISNIRTSGRLTAGTVSYPNIDGTNGQVLTTNGSGTLTWTSVINASNGKDGQLLTSNGNGGYSWQDNIQGVSKIKIDTLDTSSYIIDPFGFGWNSFSSYPGSSLDVITAENIGNGKNVLSNNVNGIANVAFGINNLSNNISGHANTAVGFNSLKENTSGQNNSAFGTYTLHKNTIGISNSAFGNTAMISNTTGDYNSAFGESSLFSNTIGYNNSAFGGGALNKNISGAANSAFGANSLQNNTIGEGNTAIGSAALWHNISGSFNTAIGDGADVSNGLLTNTTIIGNGAIGTLSNTVQLGNTAVENVITSGKITAGSVTYPNTHGSNGQVLTTSGSGELTWTTINSGNPVSGLQGTVWGETLIWNNLSNAWQLSGNISLAIGNGSGLTNQGLKSVAIGNNSGKVAQGDYSVAIGSEAGKINQDLSAIALGEKAGFDSQRVGAIAIGERAGNLSQGVGAIAVGGVAGLENQGDEGIAIGGAAGHTSQGEYSIAIGNSSAIQSQGQQSIAIGRVAGNSNQGNESIAIGKEAGMNDQGSNSVAIGSLAGHDSQSTNSIILNASGNVLNSPNPGLYIKPIRLKNNIRGKVLMYDNSTSEIYNSTSLNINEALTTGDVTYPTTHGTPGQVLTTSGSGTLTWTTPVSVNQTITLGQNLELGGYVIYVTPNGKHGLVVPLQDQADLNHRCDGYSPQSIVSDPNNYDVYGQNFTDWRVPTKYELGLIYSKRNEIGGFVTTYGIGGYWSSTEAVNETMYYLFFLDNSTFTTQQKFNYLGMVRAIRSF